ncbi:MAG: pyridoxamine 5'-phosphate oxidase family protein [Chloroflexi bacterium]|nr:pyridoxamine 5'-phosphate oxidase family protein [Chloroflexota bacterium]
MASTTQHSQAEILEMMEGVPVAVVATKAGDTLRNRMMHYAADENLNVYAATMKGDPKTIQLTNQPSISLLIHSPGADINGSKEVEITGKAVFSCATSRKGSAPCR